MKYLVVLLTLIFCSILIIEDAVAQTKITFQIDMADAMEQKLFDPTKDKIRVLGGFPPLNSAPKLYLKDTSPKDSVFSVTVNFGQFYKGRILQYNFELEFPDRTLREELPRQVRIQGKEIELPAVPFGASAN